MATIRHHDEDAFKFLSLAWSCCSSYHLSSYNLCCSRPTRQSQPESTVYEKRRDRSGSMGQVQHHPPRSEDIPQVSIEHGLWCSGTCVLNSSLSSSGEFHPWRLPVPSLWPDILEKFKAAGLNAVSIYTHMGVINPAPGVIDLDGWRAIQPFLDAAREVGLWVVLRPGQVSRRWLSAIALILQFQDPTSTPRHQQEAFHIGLHLKSPVCCARMPQTFARHGKTTSKHSSRSLCPTRSLRAVP